MGKRKWNKKKKKASSDVVKVDQIEQCLFESDSEYSSISSQEDISKCKSKKIKKVPGEKICGTKMMNKVDILETREGEDVISEEGREDVISEEVGEDVISEEGREDVISEEGREEVISGEGEDVISEEGREDVISEEGREEVISEEGREDVISEEGREDVISEEGREDVISEEGREDVISGEGREEVISGEGEDVISGEGREEVISGEGREDVISGEAEEEWISGEGEEVEISGVGGENVVYVYESDDIIERIDSFVSYNNIMGIDQVPEELSVSEQEIINAQLNETSPPRPLSPLVLVVQPNNAQIPSPTSPENLHEDQVDANDNTVRKKAKKGCANPALWKRNVHSKDILQGKGKKCRTRDCECALNCSEKISIEQRKTIFRLFYNKKSWSEQTACIVGSVKQVDKNRNTVVGHPSRRDRTRYYYLKDTLGNDVRVCKKFYQDTMDISCGRLDRALKNASIDGVARPDMRGRHEPGNKRLTEDVQGVIDFISRFPTYKSHYTREQNPHKTFFAPGLSITKIYKLYCNECRVTGKNAVSFFIFSDIFKKSFTIGFHAPQKDTCKTCDAYDVKIKAASDSSAKTALESGREKHHINVEITQKLYSSDKKKTGETTITFDLMKTLPTPLLSTGLVYYKRQLWTFCLGIHDSVKKNGFMQVWDETQASRGPCEIASGLLQYFKTNPPKKTINAWSDACGGQNRNIYMAMFWLYLVENFDVDVIRHKFFVSGHSYNDADKDFGIIEKRKPDRGVYLPEHWADVIREAKDLDPFIVTQMQREDFLNFKKLTSKITHRKIDQNGEKVKWLKIMLIEIRKENPLTLFFKYSHTEEEPYHQLDLSKKVSRKSGPITVSLSDVQLNTLNEDPVKLAPAKVTDLQSLLEYIPPAYQDFYRKLAISEDDAEESFFTDEEEDDIIFN
ncbi:hypothetical protein WDU94_010799 [Cyamophila willieti]